MKQMKITLAFYSKSALLCLLMSLNCFYVNNNRAFNDGTYPQGAFCFFVIARHEVAQRQTVEK